MSVFSPGCRSAQHFGVLAEVEPNGRAAALDLISLAPISIFLLSDNFFYDERTLELLRHAVDTKRTCVIVVMPGAKWGEHRDKTFPENAFNKTWSPFVPEVRTRKLLTKRVAG